MTLAHGDNLASTNKPTANRWYLAYTKPRQEQIALTNLEQQAFEAYLPLYKKFKKTEQGPVALFEPMFPRYILFRPGKPEQSISVVRHTKGIASIVRFGFEPAMLNDELVQRIRLLEQDRSHATMQELSNLKIGQAVRLKHTALGGVEGLIQSVSSKRVAVLLEILGRPTLVQLAHHQVEVADH
ncbi:transcription termination/antitermination protein NusG [Limnohabitans sp. Jir72]|uniref:transcription termination/antitermination protein NusG n=1 Tax=Limnohabitans sp. Jir72 TaxID=1977909 RepID=UPI000D3D9A51|nr:transcription termination/antitermination NusG family protein [Limnohabitans sp. Jir72]PUE34241.1 transcriptional activator RfaH [Limnohabitans sp. Jir72]